MVIAPEGIESYFGYSVALAAWMRFVSAQVGKDGVFELPAGVEVKKNEKTILVLDTYSEEKANALMSLALAEGAKVVAVLSLTGSDAHADHGCVFHSLLYHSDTLFLLSHPKLGWLLFLIRTIFKWYLKIVRILCLH